MNRSWSWPIGILTAVVLAGCGGSSAAPASPSASALQSSAPAAGASSAAASAASSARPSAAASASAKPSGSAAASIAPAPPGTLLTSYSELTAINAPLWLAVDAGLFKKEGLQVEARLIESSLGVGALLSDEVKFAAMGGSESLAAAVNGADLVALATLSPVYPYKLEVRNSIKSPEDLKGKKLGISRIGSSSDSATRAALRKLGLNPDTDVTLVQVGSLAARMAALFSGNLDGAVAALPDTLKIEAQGYHPIIDLAAQRLPAVNNTLVARRGWVNSHKEETQKYVNGVVDGIRLAKSDKAQTVEVMKKYLKQRSGDERALDATYEFYVNQVFQIPPVSSAELFHDALEQLSRKEAKAKNFDVNSIIDNSFAKKAAQASAS